MKITFRNETGLIQRKVRLGRNDYNLVLLYNYSDNYWYLSINGYLSGKRIVANRVLFETTDGQLKATSVVGKLTFSELEWIPNED